MKARPKSRRDRDSGTVVSVRVQPKASKNGVERLEDGTFKVRLTAPPVDGAANKALVALLARALGVSRSAVTIVSGETSRDKRISLGGLTPDEINGLLNAKKK